MSDQDERYVLALDHRPDVTDLAALEDAVVSAVQAAAGVGADEEFAVVVRDADGRMVAGLAALSWGRCCQLQSMWVAPELRRHGWARRLVAAAEAEARRRGCSQVTFLAYDVVLPGFYTRLGYETVGVLADCPVGSGLRWYRKAL